jgi:hypothetical protein
MTIDMQRSGFALCVEQRHEKDAIWKAPSGMGDQLFQSLKTLYCPDGRKEDANDLPLILTKPEAIRYK